MNNTIEKQLSYVTALIEYVDQNEPVAGTLISKINYHGLNIDLRTTTNLKSNFNNFRDLYDKTRNYELSDYEEEIYPNMITLLETNKNILISELLEKIEWEELINT